MPRKLISFALIIALSVAASFKAVYANSQDEKQARSAAKVKQKISELGTGKNARVEVQLKDGTKLKGYVSEIKDDSFVVIGSESGAVTPIAYSQVKRLKGRGLSTGAKILVWLGVTAGVLLLIDLIVDD